MSRPFKLFRLQQIDTQLDMQRGRLKKIETALSDDSELRQIEGKLAILKEETLLTQNSLRGAEFETLQQRIKIEQTEAALYGGKVRNPKELQDLQNELAALKRYLSVLDERQFEAMLKEEDASQRYELMIEEQTRIQHEHSQQIQQLNIEKEKLFNEIKNSENERDAAEAVVEPGDIAMYQQLRLKRRGLAVSKIVDKACVSCGSTLSAALLNAAHSPNQLSFCESCGRILYFG
jgi:predicted  nucleic acid-binding Zn-ribbon protein